MKVYVGNKKLSKEKVKFGITVYAETGHILYSTHVILPSGSNKFDNPLNALIWGTKKLNPLIEKGTLPEEQIYLFIDNTCVYNWCEQTVVPVNYTKAHTDLMLEFSFLLNPTEVILSKSAPAKVLYKDINCQANEVIKAMDFFNSID